MEQPITRSMHGMADYVYAPLVFAAPGLGHFKQVTPAAQLCRVIGLGTLASTLLTRAEWGVVRVVPFKTHLLLDVAVSAFSLAAPWLFKFAHNRRATTTFLIMGAVGAVVTSLTQPREMTP